MHSEYCDDMLDEARDDECFLVNDSNFVDELNKTKQAAVWDKNATLALLSLYEAKMDMLEHPKKKSKIWEAISTALQHDFGIEMSMDQVRWKMNALIKKYKECVDNNSKSGRNPMTFKWFDQMDEIFNQGKDVITNHNFSSKFVHTMSKPSTSSIKEVYLKPTASFKKDIYSKSPTISTSTLSTLNNSGTLLERCSNDNLHNISPSTSSMLNEKLTNSKGLLHETNRNVTRDKVALEKQWLEYIKVKIERDKVSDENRVSTLEQKKEMLKLKRKHLALKEEEMKQRKEYFTAKLKIKENRHAEIASIENKKCKLLKKLLKVSSSDSE